MKNKKLSLGSLEVKSFVTNLESSQVDTVKGGATSFVDLSIILVSIKNNTDIGCCPDLK